MTAPIIHKPKIGLEFLVPIVLVLGTVMTIMIINLVWIGMVIVGLIIMLAVNIYTKTDYRITADERLVIKCGILESFDIPIKDIEWIRQNDDAIFNATINSPALSVDRLEIGYKGGKVLVSPRNKNEFVSDLKRLNSKIWWTSKP